MFARIAALATFAIPLVSALTLNTPTSASIGDMFTFSWDATTADPSSFNLYMVNTIFHNTFAISTDVQTSAGSMTIVLPQAPLGSGYTLEATSISNVNSVLATSGGFTVTATTTTSTSTTSTMSTSMGTSMGTMSGASTVSLTSSASTSASSGSTPSAISGAASLKISTGPVAVVLLSAAAGAAIMF
ncbi:hypothetical protein BDR03DRAFT_982187 [Suillus americanus]|nr:hypothetical protein BDR03DRAFT_982187 [Suillus americanus]